MQRDVIGTVKEGHIAVFIMCEWIRDRADELEKLPINPFSTRPHQNVVWYNNSWLGFLKILNYVPKEREKNMQKMSPHLSQLNVAMAHRNYFRRNNLQSLKLATYAKIEDHYSRCNIGNFLDWKGLPNVHRAYFILSTQNIKFYWFVMKIKKFLLPIWWYNRGLFPLRNKYFGGLRSEWVKR